MTPNMIVPFDPGDDDGDSKVPHIAPLVYPTFEGVKDCPPGSPQENVILDLQDVVKALLKINDTLANPIGKALQQIQSTIAGIELELQKLIVGQLQVSVNNVNKVYTQLIDVIYGLLAPISSNYNMLINYLVQTKEGDNLTSIIDNSVGPVNVDKGGDNFTFTGDPTIPNFPPPFPPGVYPPNTDDGTEPDKVPSLPPSGGGDNKVLLPVGKCELTVNVKLNGEDGLKPDGVAPLKDDTGDDPKCGTATPSVEKGFNSLAYRLTDCFAGDVNRYLAANGVDSKIFDQSGEISQLVADAVGSARGVFKTEPSPVNLQIFIGAS